jgi:hypothetical protein
MFLTHQRRQLHSQITRHRHPHHHTWYPSSLNNGTGYTIPGIMMTNKKLKCLYVYEQLHFLCGCCIMIPVTIRCKYHLKSAFNSGRYGVNAGGVSGPGIKWRFNTITTAITKTVTAATNRNMNLSVIVLRESGIKGNKSQDPIYYIYIDLESIVLSLDS